MGYPVLVNASPTPKTQETSQKGGLKGHKIQRLRESAVKLCYLEKTEKPHT